MKRLFTIAIPLMAIMLQPPTARAEGQKIASKTFGFEIVLPEGWNIATQEQLEWNDEHSTMLVDGLKEKLKSGFKLPLLSAMRFPEPYPDINPDLTINAVLNRAETSLDPIRVATQFEETALRFGRKAEILAEPQTLTIDGIQTAHVTIKSELEAEGQEFPIVLESWFVPRTRYYLIISITYRPDGKTGSRNAAAASVMNMKLDKPAL